MERKEFLKSLGMSGLMVPLMIACSKDGDVTPVPVINSFSPSEAAIGSSITVSGLNFSSTASNNVVKFNGTTANVTSATSASLTVTVPSGATTGKISVTVGANTATASSDFTVTTATSTSLSITGFTSSGTIGASIIITGTNFSTTASANAVKINGILATVTAATATQLTVTVPAGATSGPISVTVNGVTVTSTASFSVGTTSTSCTTTSSETEGPFPTKSPSSLVMSDIRSDRTGVLLNVKISILNKNNSCAALANAIVDIWHCDKDGNYSEYGGSGMQSTNYTTVHFLRGRQTTDTNGQVGFTTIFPGWYRGRATHIHVHVYNSSGTSLLVTQIAFPEGSGSAVATVNASTANGYTKGMTGYTYNASDNVFSDGVSNEMSVISGDITGGFSLTHSIVVNG